MHLKRQVEIVSGHTSNSLNEFYCNESPTVRHGGGVFLSLSTPFLFVLMNGLHTLRNKVVIGLKTRCKYCIGAGKVQISGLAIYYRISVLSRFNGILL